MIPPYQLMELIGQFLDYHSEAFQLLKHADKILAGKVTGHLQV